MRKSGGQCGPHLNTLKVYVSTVEQSYKVAYGARFQFNERAIFGCGWIRGNQSVDGQMMAAVAVLDALALREVDVRVALIMRTEWLRERLSMRMTKSIAEQHNERVRPMKRAQDWHRASLLWALYRGPIVKARIEADKKQLKWIERALQLQFTDLRSPFGGTKELEADFDIPMRDSEIAHRSTESPV
jgi:hypothetical protein